MKTTMNRLVKRSICVWRPRPTNLPHPVSSIPIATGNRPSCLGEPIPPPPPRYKYTNGQVATGLALYFGAATTVTFSYIVAILAD